MSFLETARPAANFRDSARTSPPRSPTTNRPLLRLGHWEAAPTSEEERESKPRYGAVSFLPGRNALSTGAIQVDLVSKPNSAPIRSMTSSC